MKPPARFRAAAAPAPRPTAPHLTPVVYTMGKVASSSISAAILRAGLPCHDIHTLNPEGLRQTAQDWLERGEFPPPHVCVSMAHRDRLFVKTQRCLYITLVRDPIARNLSAFFQNLALDVDFRDEAKALPLFRRFMETYTHNQPVSWFNREFRDQLGIDVFERPFDPATGHVHIRGKNTVIFRVDCDDAVKGAVLSDLLGCRIEIGRENDGDTKEYRERYEAVKSLAVFPKEFTDRIYDSRFARHFWTDAERDRFRARWTRPE
jgi:hypothetical protein